MIQSCLSYWTQYSCIVGVWMNSKNIQIVRNGKQLFEFLIGLRPGNKVDELLKSLSNREKFLEEPLIMYCESIFSVLQVHGGKRIYQVNERVENEKIDWDQEIEDETQILERLEGNLGKKIFFCNSQNLKQIQLPFNITNRLVSLINPL
jgi:hypothetical protein